MNFSDYLEVSAKGRNDITIIIIIICISIEWILTVLPHTPLGHRRNSLPISEARHVLRKRENQDCDPATQGSRAQRTTPI